MLDFEISALHALALQRAGGVSDSDIRQLLLTIPYQKIFDLPSLREYLKSIGAEKLFPQEKAWNSALSIIETSEKHGISLITINNDGYPKYLKAIDDAPSILHLRGNRECLSKLPGISVVGTRKVTENGSKIAYRIANFLAKNDWTVISGLALGVDAIAHKAALDSGKRSATIAVLAHGLEQAKPVANRELGYAILENGGAWVSEHPVGTPPQPSQFVARNRIQLGLSVGSVIIEAELKSGSVTQAKFCVKQRRPLFAVVPEFQNNPLALLSSGTEMMVQDMGAYPLKNRDDYPVMLERFGKQYSLMVGL